MNRSTSPRSTVHRNLTNRSTPNFQITTPNPNLKRLGVGNWDLGVDPRDVSRRRFLHVGTIALGGAFVAARLAAQTRITTIDLGGATLFQGAGGNVIALPGPDGTLMIDGGLAANGDALLGAVKKATSAVHIATLINTHWHPEQTGSNEAVGRAGGVILAHEKTKMMLSNTVYSAIGF